MAKPVALFNPYSLINKSYGALRVLTVNEKLAPKDRPSSINHFAVGFVREIAAGALSSERVDQILCKHGGRGVWRSASPLLKFTPELVKEVIESGKLSEHEFAQLLENEAAFLKFAEREAEEPGNRKRGMKSR